MNLTGKKNTEYPCDCGNIATKKTGRYWVCDRCLAIEAKMAYNPRDYVDTANKRDRYDHDSGPDPDSGFGMPLTRKCPSCLETKPLDSKHFHARKDDAHGFNTRCARCRNVLRKKQGYAFRKAPPKKWAIESKSPSTNSWAVDESLGYHCAPDDARRAWFLRFEPQSASLPCERLRRRWKTLNESSNLRLIKMIPSSDMLAHIARLETETNQ